ncbi:unnamed protein product [Candidula unifasciata]|uniref:Uncharacterized protein n=1 Tax=Candidula unifasciata TaxID=100452 RepID=A0A8S3YWB5_9EUPU|nr:unnamed protein product [Candidula unifasciata]
MNDKIFRVICVLLAGFLWTSALDLECVYQGCYCDYDSINCGDMDLTAMPEITGDSTAFMPQVSLDRNQISRISAGSLIANISGLSVAENPVKTIDEAAFNESLNTLQSLVFSGAAFAQIPDAVLQLRNLISLSVSNTNITTWNDSGMAKLGSGIQILILDTVGLTTWPTWLQVYSRLLQLTISGSSISSIPDNAFDLSATSLRELSLNNNNLVTVPKALANLTELIKLSLAQNRIANITWLPQLSKLTSLSLNDNRISDSVQLSTALRSYGSTLNEFNIHDNLLTSIPDTPLLTQLTTLDFTHNHISDPNSGSVSSAVIVLKLDYNRLRTIPRVLKTINSKYIGVALSYNSIFTIQGIDFPNSTTNVDLGGNFIQELSDTSFPVNSSIMYLYLYNNPLTKVSPLAFRNLPQLRDLNLRNTRLTRLPLAIASLTGLWSIDVTGSTYLVCTCEEKSLEAVIRAVYDIFGDCGPTSLYTFYNEFSPMCSSDK